MRVWIAICLVGLTLVLASPVRVLAQRLDVPPRSPLALSGSAFAETLDGLKLEEREARIVAEVLQGNMPEWLRELQPVRIASSDSHRHITCWVTPDYLAVGSDTDYLLVPLTPQAAQHIADSLNMSLPTPKIVDATWENATLKMVPEPISPSPEMTTVPVFWRHSVTVYEQRRRAATPMGDLVAGHKKDVVVTRTLAVNPGRVAIYGWHKPNGEPIQPLYLGHTDRWVDYSHGVRLVSRSIEVDGATKDLWNALRDPAFATMLSSEGVIEQPWYIGR